MHENKSGRIVEVEKIIERMRALGWRAKIFTGLRGNDNEIEFYKATKSYRGHGDLVTAVKEASKHVLIGKA